MCGIIGYKGIKNANEVVLNGLKDLEYRGYDSWGIASLTDKIKIVKEAGKVSTINLEDLNLENSNIAIGHTRWATHGGINEKNAHPHFAENEEFALVQNGIVENFQELRFELKNEGYNFNTETDTEVIVKLIEFESKKQDLEKAIFSAFKKLKGRNGIVVIEKNTKKIFALKNGSPLLLGIGDNEFLIASDPSPVLQYTRKVIFLDDNEGVIINDNYKIIDVNTGEEKEKEIESLNWEIEQAKKGDFPHFMIKEIFEQKETINQALIQDPEQIKRVATDINDAVGVYACGCGTAGKVCMTGMYPFSTIAKKHINFSFGSEFPNFKPFITSQTLMIIVSQSGETADTLEAMNVVKEKGGKIISLVNVMGSTIMRKSDYSFLLNAGPEIAVASTKATTSQLALMILLAYATANRYGEGMEVLKKTASSVKEIFENESLDKIKGLAKNFKDKNDMYIIGRGLNFPIALEAAIKIQEVSYIHAEGFAGGELKHGPIALIEKGTPVIGFVPNDETKSDIISNLIEVKSRGAFIVGIGPENNEVFDIHIKVPDVGMGSPIVNLIPIQLLSYYLAVEKGLDPDKPRNLAKSVTVV